MDLKELKSAASSNLEKLGNRVRSLAPGTIYGSLCASTLLPVISAVGLGDFGAVGALCGVLGSMGGGLVAGRIQEWRDQSEAELATELGEKAKDDPEWRDVLDKLLEEFESPRIIQGVLSEADSTWFTDTLKDELSKLGNLERYQAMLVGDGAIAQGEGAKSAVKRGVAAETIQDSIVIPGDQNVAAKGHIVVATEGATVVINEPPVTMTAVDRKSALGRYLRRVISHNRYLQLQGIRSGGKLVQIELDRIYIRLRATRQRMVEAEERWLAQEAALAPGEIRRPRQQHSPTMETVTVKVEDALADYPRLVVLGDPGSGKTTLLRYLSLLYARDLAEGSMLLREKLGLDESGWLPILLPLRQIGAFLSTQRPTDDGTEGHAVLLDFLGRSLKGERIELPADFFDPWLTSGKAVILLDRLDEVADPDLRRRVSRLAENFTQAYPECRYVVTSRIVGYTGTARLGEGYTTTTVRDFTMADVEQFLTNWHRLLAIGQMGPGESAEAHAAKQTGQLLQAIRANERIRELTINPLMLTVIAMVHRDRVKLPDRRAELYAEAVDVLLGKWEEAKGVPEVSILPGKPFDTGDKRVLLQSLAIYMHEQEKKEIDVSGLRQFLEPFFCEILQVGENSREVERAVTRFVEVVEERTGLLVPRGEGTYAFSHLTFQEYLAALAVGARDDYITYTLSRVSFPWWREVVLLEAGYLSTQGKERTTSLIRAIADLKQEPEPYHNLVLAAECLRDVGTSRVQGNLETEVQQRLRKELETPRPLLSRWFKSLGATGWIERQEKAMEPLVRAGSGYWSPPYGEPEWVHIPDGEFWMGSQQGNEGEKPQHKINLADYRIARVPVTNTQYHLFVQNCGCPAPNHWEENRPPKGLESHPVVNVSWYDAVAYGKWLSEVTGEKITLPSEAEWEKAARGDRDWRVYPWGDTFDPNRCNFVDLGLGRTTPVGIFRDGASPYGCLDMSGNVWEWTRSLWGKDGTKTDFGYPYNPADGREKLDAPDEVRRVLRGGGFHSEDDVRCALRVRLSPGNRSFDFGFRVVASPSTSGP